MDLIENGKGDRSTLHSWAQRSSRGIVNLRRNGLGEVDRDATRPCFVMGWVVLEPTPDCDLQHRTQAFSV
jgi:hypothetical protein